MRRRTLCSYIVLVVFVGLLAAGLALDEFRAVLGNAITICLSCIGIG